MSDEQITRTPNLFNRWGVSYGSQLTYKVLAIILLSLLVLIPIYMIQTVIEKRAQRYEEVIREVGERWGAEQKFIGPALVLPYLKKVTENGRGIEKSSKFFFFPSDLKVTAQLNPERKYRGIYEAVVFEGEIDVQGVFTIPTLDKVKQAYGQAIQENDILWDQAYISVGLEDNRGLPDKISLNWGGTMVPFLPGGKADNFLGQGGFHAPLKERIPFPRGGEIPFSFQFKVNGSKKFGFVPVGQTNFFEVKAPWADPSFRGRFLPTKKHITDGAFSASWNISYFERNFPQFFMTDLYLGLSEYELKGNTLYREIQNSAFEVELFQPLSAFKMAERASKYAIIFVIYTFVLLFVFELITRRPIHTIQYGLLALAHALFFMIFLAFSEHLGFVMGFWLATASVLLQITAYAYKMLRTWVRTMVAFTVWFLLYIYLFVVLNLEDYALMIGALGLFIALSAIFIAVRNVNWYGSISGTKSGD